MSNNTKKILYKNYKYYIEYYLMLQPKGEYDDLLKTLPCLLKITDRQLRRYRSAKADEQVNIPAEKLILLASILGVDIDKLITEKTKELVLEKYCTDSPIDKK